MYKIIGVDGREYGPISAEQVRQWIAEGRANAATITIAEGGTEWKPLGSFPEFSHALASAGPAPAPASAFPGSPVRKTHPLAVTGLVLGIVAITLGWCCCGMGLPISVVGAVLSVIGLLEINKHPEAYGGKGVAIAGLVLCLAHLLVAGALMVVSGVSSDPWKAPRKVHRL